MDCNTPHDHKVRIPVENRVKKTAEPGYSPSGPRQNTVGNIKKTGEQKENGTCQEMVECNGTS